MRNPTNGRNVLLWLCGWLVPFFFVSGNLSAQDYFQQRCVFEIDVRLDDKKHVLHASERLTYTNNSNDTLTFIWFHLWPNAYKDRNTALARDLVESGDTKLFFSKAEQRGYIDSLDFKINEIPAKFMLDSIHSDMGKLYLLEPLYPGQSVVITTPFRVKIPAGSFSRLGRTGKQYLITQWFPKPAVYDRNGWHQMPYLNTGEFYSEFGSFHVRITLPENYVVAATGRLQENAEREWLLQKAEQTRNLDLHPDSMAYPPSSTTLKTITFVQDSVHDFAFFADKRYQVLYDTLQDPASGKIVECWNFFTNKNAALWMNGMGYMKKAMRFYSERCGAYPYASVTAVDGLNNMGSDMEYPMITVIGSPRDAFMLEDLFVHEIGHNWFHGILGTDERKHPWMDEGVNTAFEAWYMEYHRKPKGDNDLWSFPGITGNLIGTKDQTFADGLMLRYRSVAYNKKDQPANLAADEYTTENYSAIVYNKTGIVFNYLRNYLGDSLFASCFQQYYKQWAFKHPGPADMQQVFESHSGRQLNWFFSGLIGTSGQTDLKPHIINDSLLSVKEKGTVLPPVPYSILNGDSVVKSGFTTPGTNLVLPENAAEVVSTNPYLPDINPFNNRAKKSGLLRSLPKLDIRMSPTLAEKESRYMFTALPLPAWNAYNGFMAGGVLTNISIIPKKTEFQLTPLWDFENSELAGAFSIAHHVYPEKGFADRVTVSFSGKSFGYLSDITFPNYPEQSYDLLSYHKLDPGITISMRKRVAKSTVDQQFNFRNIHIWQEEIIYTETGGSYIPSKETAHLYFNAFSYQLKNSRTLDPFSLNVAIENAANHTKSSVEFIYKFSYPRYGRGLQTRIFAGTFLNNDEPQRNYNFRMSGWDGSDDYRYDEYYFGRNETEGLWSRQFLIRDGGFIVPTAVGQTDSWLAAINIHADLPIPFPVKVFLDIGTYDGIKEVFPDIGNTFMYDGGICLSAGYDLFEIYVPLFVSDDIQSNLDANDIKLKETIRFVLNINRLSLQRMRNQLLKWI
jgi:hypothetical protein